MFTILSDSHTQCVLLHVGMKGRDGELENCPFVKSADSNLGNFHSMRIFLFEIRQSDVTLTVCVTLAIGSEEACSRQQYLGVKVPEQSSFSNSTDNVGSLKLLLPRTRFYSDIALLNGIVVCT